MMHSAKEILIAAETACTGLPWEAMGVAWLPGNQSWEIALQHREGQQTRLVTVRDEVRALHDFRDATRKAAR